MNDEPGWSWPAWKFGMKRSDLFTKLHDQYNTLSTPIQDKEAFHHDVYEIANRSSCRDEFHRLLAERKEERLTELNNGLELASVKIISNPSLIGTEQWPLAIQLFRARSLDALVRYFSSYLNEHPWNESDAETIDSGSVMSTRSSISSADTDVNSEVDGHLVTFFDKGITTHEPLSITTSPEEPLSPPTTDEAASSPIDTESQDGDDYSPHRSPSPVSRSMSFSESESDHIPEPLSCRKRCRRDSNYTVDDEQDDCSLPDDDTPNDPAEIEPDFSQPAIDDDLDSSYPSEQPSSAEEVDSDMPTPRPLHSDTCSSTSSATKRLSLSISNTFESSPLISSKVIAHLRRSPSPCRRARLAHADAREVRHTSPRLRKREVSPQVSRTPCELSSCRVQKSLPDQSRMRTRGGSAYMYRIDVD